MFLFCLVFAMFCARLFICASWSPAGKGLTSWLSFVVSSVSLLLSHWCASVYMCFVVTCWERADLLALVCGVFCEFVTFPLVSWVRCGT